MRLILSSLSRRGVVELVKLPRSISNNVNQIARRRNSTHNHVEYLRQGYNAPTPA